MTLHPCASSSSSRARFVDAEKGAEANEGGAGELRVWGDEKLVEGVVEIAVEDPAVEGGEEGFGDL